MHCAPFSRRGGGDDRRGLKRMRERDDAVVDPGDPGALRRIQILYRSASQGGGKGVERRPRKQRGRQQQLSRRCRQGGDPLANQLANVIRHRQRLAAGWHGSAFHENPSNLKCEQRVALGRRVKANEH